MKKLTIKNFFPTIATLHMADFVAVRMEQANRYYIFKGRMMESGIITDEEGFMEMIKGTKRPIVLSDTYIDLVSSEEESLESEEESLK